MTWKEVVDAMTREQKLTFLANMQLDDEQSTFDGHNSALAALGDLVIVGRKGLIDFVDEELDDSLGFYAEWAIDEKVDSVELAVERSGRVGRIAYVSCTGTWGWYSADVQEKWDAEEEEN